MGIGDPNVPRDAPHVAQGGAIAVKNMFYKRAPTRPYCDNGDECAGGECVDNECVLSR